MYNKFLYTESTVEKSGKKRRHTFAKCVCGKQFSRRVSLYKETSKCNSCVAGDKKRTHGHGGKRTPEYYSWSSMKTRCYNINDNAYNNYGGRGIKVCDRWMLFENFLEDMGKRPSDCTLDRIDNNKGYNPENCKWSTKKQQMQNQSNTLFYIYKGEKRSLKYITEDLNLSHDAVYKRIKISGWDIDKAINTPIRRRSTSASNI